MEKSGKKIILYIIPVFCVWIIALIYSFLQFTDGYLYGLGYGQMLTPTITNEAATHFFVNGSENSLSIVEIGVGKTITFCSYSDGMIKITRNGSMIDLENSHIIHVTDSGRAEVTTQELFEIIRNLNNGAPVNTQIEVKLSDSKYNPQLEYIQFTGEYEGEIQITEYLSFPAEYTNYDEFVSGIKETHHRKLAVASIFVIAGMIVLSVPLVVLAIKKKHMALLIYCIVGAIFIVLLAKEYNHYSHLAIGINWYDRVN